MIQLVLLAAAMLLTEPSPYQQGVADYRAGKCFRIQAFSPDPQEWIRGFNDEAKRKPRREPSACHINH